MICTRSCKDLLGRTSPGSPQDLVRRIRTREELTRLSTRPLRGFHQDHFVRACACKTHMDISEESFYARMYRKNGVPHHRDPPFAQACAVNMHMGWVYHKMHFMREFTGIQNPENIRTQLTIQKIVASSRTPFHYSLRKQPTKAYLLDFAICFARNMLRNLKLLFAWAFIF